MYAHSLRLLGLQVSQASLLTPCLVALHVAENAALVCAQLPPTAEQCPQYHAATIDQ